MDDNKMTYEAPKLVELGSLEELTEQLFNKVGGTPDGHGQIVGSLINFP